MGKAAADRPALLDAKAPATRSLRAGCSMEALVRT